MANKKDRDAQRQLNAAISAADVTSILSLLDDPSLDLNAGDRGHDLQTPLMRMCHMDVYPESLCAILDKLEHCAWNPNVQDATGRALLMHACIADKIDVVDMCLANGCDVSLVDRDGNSAIIYAIRSGNESMLGLILEQEECLPLLTKTNNSGYTPVEVANHEGYVTMANRLSALLPAHLTKASRRSSKGKGQTPRNGKAMKRQASLSHHILETNGLPLSQNDRNLDDIENGHLSSRPLNSSRQPTSFSEHVMHTTQLKGDSSTDGRLTQRRMTSDSDRTSHSEAAVGIRHKNSQELPGNAKKTQRLLRRDTVDLPPADDKNSSQKGGKPGSKQLGFCRKDSSSLPDLRDFKRKLVTSGDLTPADAMDSPEGRSIEEKEEEDVFSPSDSYVEMYKKSASSCSLPPLLSNSADSDRRKERQVHNNGRSKPKKANGQDEVMLRSLIV